MRPERGAAPPNGGAGSQVRSSTTRPNNSVRGATKYFSDYEKKCRNEGDLLTRIARLEDRIAQLERYFMGEQIP